MKLCMIKASARGEFKKYKSYQGSPPQNIFSLAAATPDGVEYELIDETAGQRVPLRTEADLIVLFMSTPDAMRGYELADLYRKKGKTVIIGGLHASFLPDEAAAHADSVMIGEVEDYWPQVLEDYEAGRLQARYESDKLVDVSTLNPYPHAKIDLSRYQGCSTVLVGRGCKFKCTYCTIPEFFVNLRFRPVGDIVDEIKNSGLNFVELHADNLMADPDYAMELFTALKPLGITWVGEATINIGQNDELLKAAAESGCTYLVVGLETASQMALKNAGKGFVRVDRVKDNIRNLHDHGIAVDSAMLFGFDEHDEHIFKETLEWVDDIQLDVAHAVILTPFPGTALFQQMEQEGRLLTRDWRKYDCNHVVFEPAQMTARDLLDGRDWFHMKHNSLIRSWNRSKHYPEGLRFGSAG